jgi:hypothetical protein
MRKYLALLLAVVAASLPFDGQVTTGKAATSRTVCLSAAANTIGPITVPANVPSKRLVSTAEIAGYGAPGETAAYQYNGDTGNNYSVFWTTTADGITWASGANTAAATDRIRIGPADTQNQRIVVATIFDNSAKTEHMVVFDSATGTGSTTNSSINVGNGKWVSSVATAITSVKLVTTNANMGGGSCLTVSW